jgi:hypothetical protein
MPPLFVTILLTFAFIPHDAKINPNLPKISFQR